MEIEEGNSVKLYDACSKTILLLCKDKYNSRDYKTNLEMLGLSTEKKDIIHNVTLCLFLIIYIKQRN